MNADPDVAPADSASDRAVWAIPVLLIPLILWGNPLYAILAGAALAVIFNRRIWAESGKWGKLALQTAIILLGFNLDARNLWTVSQGYAGVIALYVIATFGAGLALAYLLRVDRVLGQLMAAGTAICGGTAIAALSPVIRARGDQMAVALTIVFFLNMVALLVFPLIGEALEMSQFQFGLWSALAVHDTSSVVAVAAVYGQEAAEIATTLKLGRTLWLIPLMLGFSLLQGSGEAKIRIPSFIILFIFASIAGSLLQSQFAMPQSIYDGAKYVSGALIIVALFFIGLECTRTTFRNLRGRVVMMALALWLAVVPLTLAMALYLA
jgi:uncharacterized integral membrane protein (TIGR00698 family)